MKRLLPFFIAMLSFIDVYPTHIAGGVIEVVCVNNNTFQITVRLYRDGTVGFQYPANITLTIDPIGPGTNTSANLPKISQNLNLQPPSTNPCLVPPSNSTLEEHVYRSNVTLNTGTGYYLYWQSNARNTTINVTGQPGYSAYAEVPDPGVYGCFNSPIFNEGPPVSVCINEPLTYDNSASDADGDSLVYYFCAALNSAPAAPPFNAVPYNNPYNPTYPVSSSPALAINPNTGIVTGTPNLGGKWVFSVCVDEYRNGVKIGHVVRDVQMTVTTCNTQVLANVGTNYTSVNLGIEVIAACKSYTVTFNNTSSGGTNASYLWDFGVPGITTDTSTQFSPTYTYPDTGTFLVTLISNPGYICADTIKKTVIVYPVVDADFAVDSPRCSGQSINFSDQTTTTYGTINWWQWNFGHNSVPPSGTANPIRTYPTPGIYNVRLVIEMSKGCRDTIIKPVEVFESPIVDAGPGTLRFCAGEGVTIPATGNAISWQWTPANGLSCTDCQNPVANPTAPTVYFVTGTGIGGCTSQDQIIVQPIVLPIVSAGPDKFLCGVSSTTLNGSVTIPPGGASYQFNWSPPTGLINATTLTPTASPTATTTYVLTVTTNTAPQCIVRDTVTVYVNGVSMNAGPNQMICPGDTAQLQATTTVPNPVFLWAPAASLSDPTIANPLAFPASTTIYTLSVTDTTTGCASFGVVRVDISPLPNVNAGTDRTICINTTTQLQATGGVSYTWDTNPSLSCLNCPNPVASPSSTTTYYVTGSNMIGCEKRDSVIVTVVQPATVNISPSTSICTGTSVQLQASGGVSYNWIPSGTLDNANIANPVATPLVNTTYTVTMTDINGCTASNTVTVSLRPLPAANAGQDVTICDGDTTQLTASGGVSYAWTPSNTLSNATVANPMAFPDLNTTYTVQVTDQFGCINWDSVSVTVNKLQPGNFSPDGSICIGGSYQLFANGFVNYQWSPALTLSNPGISNPVATPSLTTIYTVVVADANNCVDSGTVTVTVNPLPTPGITATNDTICRFSPTTMLASGGTQYSWTPSSGLSCTTCPNPTVSPANSTIYTLLVTDANGCQNSTVQSITVIALPLTYAGQDETICLGDSVQLFASGADSYSWTPASTLNCTNCPDPVATPITTADYIVTGTGQFGCIRRDTVRVFVNPLPTVTVNPTSAVVCDGESIQISASGGVSYQWSPAGSLSNASIANPIASPLASTTYTVLVANSYGCLALATSDITVATPATLNMTPDTSVCPGETVQLNASGGVSYSWSPPIDLSNSNIANPIATPTQARTYTLNVLDSNGCAITATVHIDLFVPAHPQAGNDTTICYGEIVPLNASNGMTYQWQPANSVDDPSSANPFAQPGITTTYTVSIVDANGCSNMDEVIITVNQLPLVSAGDDVTIREGEGTTLTATGAQTYLWSPAVFVSDPAMATIFIVPPDSITMYVVGTDQYGCSNIDSVMVNVVPRPKYYIPNAFSPNGDGINDEFIISHYVNFNLISLKVFNRWGELVFETSDISRGWDGRSADGQPLPIATYVYTVEGIDDLDMPITRKGNITLVR